MEPYQSKVAVVGIGRWGKNLVRTFDKLTDVAAVCHRGDTSNRVEIEKNYPHITLTTDYNEILANPGINAIIISTPISTHYELARKALEAGKHVFVEKPLTDDVKQARCLNLLSRAQKLILFTGHLYWHHPVFKKLQEITHNDTIRYVEFSWEKFGTFKEDIYWDLVSHDLSIALALLGRPTVIELGEEIKILTQADATTFRIKWGRTGEATISVNRVSPDKRKKITFITDSNVYCWQDNTLWLLDKEQKIFRKFYQSEEEPLLIECRAFLDLVERRVFSAINLICSVDVVELISEIKNRFKRKNLGWS